MRMGNEIREEFVRALRQLGGNIGLAYCSSGGTNRAVEHVQSVFLSCPLEDWVKAFGRPRHVSRRREPSTGKEIDSWEEPSPQGAVRCDGHLFERSAGHQWVVVQRVRFPFDGSGGRSPSGAE